jgi:peroxiredoxin
MTRNVSKSALLFAASFGLLATAAIGAVRAGDETKIAKVGEAAPAFVLKDLDGKEVKLADHKDKIVVLEWFNPECPFVVRNHKEGGSLHTLAADLSKEGVVWLAINSGAPGQQGTGAEKNKKAVTDWKLAHPVLIDEKGEVGQLYGARTTPHMYVIDAKGVLVYAGAIDNDPNGKIDPATRIDYVTSAVKALKADKPIGTSTSKPYGCNVKYAK